MKIKEEPYLEDFESIKIDILNKVIEHTPYTGWSLETLKVSLGEIGILNSLDSFFPGGIKDISRLYFDIADKKLEYDVENIDLENKSVRDRISYLLNLRLDFFSNNKQVIKQIIGSDFFNGFSLAPISRINDSVDLMWRLAGDKSVDYNFYTKRILLGGIYISSVLFWLDSENREEVSKFIDRRIANVMKIEKNKKKFSSFFKKNKILKQFRPI